MHRQRGFIIRELMLYLFAGSLLLMVTLNLFRVSWLSFQTIRRLNEVKSDFIVVSERLKIDLYKEVHEITVGRESISFSFYNFEGKESTLKMQHYVLLMHNEKLFYCVPSETPGSNHTTVSYMTLSSLVRGVSFETEENLLTVTFDYGDYQFRRSYRLDHIPTQRFPDGIISDSAAGVCNQCRVVKPGTIGQTLREQYWYF